MCPIQQEREMIQVFSPTEVTTYKRRMTYELYTFGKWHTAASYEKPPGPCGASHLFLGGGGCKKTGAKFIIRDTAEQVGEHKETVC